ncbi:hypothetical protein T01_7571 [Trichinella spiralis]|uniref:Uncharacterized protein n=1 Tax=Trichinella spiralis TaxID=6334 RepID=A0A0V1BM22_TRISP|nr:hypothetical protein T01_7571 [Trichinella spiralis]
MKRIEHGRIRTCNLLIRSQTRYPLRHVPFNDFIEKSNSSMLIIHLDFEQLSYQHGNSLSLMGKVEILTTNPLEDGFN